MDNSSRNQVWILLLILSVAVFFRFYDLNITPPGLYPDEAMNGNNALEALRTDSPVGGFKLFYPENNGREGLFINLQAVSVQIFGLQPWALRAVSAVIGVLTILGLYLLVREIYDWRLASIAGFLEAISFWHVNFSRIGFRAIMVPFIMTYLFYFIWRGFKRGSLSSFFWAGLFGGLGFYTYTSYRVVLFIVIILFSSYWFYIKNNFSHNKYEHTRNRLLQGFSLFFLTAFFIALPLGIYFLKQPDQFTGRVGSLSVFAQPEPFKALTESTAKTLGMFNFQGDWNQRHNISGAPMLSIPTGILFLIGFFASFFDWLWKKRGSNAYILFFSWFFIMLLPGFFSTEAPHALRTIGVIPVVMIFIALGLWRIFEKADVWYKHHHQAAVLALVIFLISLAFTEYNRYFVVWAGNDLTSAAFNQDYVNIANKIKSLPESVNKYVIVEAGGTLVNGIPMPAQTIMFLTDSQSHISYYTPAQFSKIRLQSPSAIFRLR